MQPFEKFIVQGREIKDNDTVLFYYSFDEKENFVETLHFPGVDITQKECGVYLDSLSIALGISYYKLYPTELIMIESFGLDDYQKDFWHIFYIDGLGEFFYVNKIDPTGLANFVSRNQGNCSIDETMLPNKNIVLWGGGKDSAVTRELLKEEGKEMALLTVGKKYPIHLATSAVTGDPHLFVYRVLDIAQLKKLIGLGYYQGHVPMTGIISFIATVVCKLYGFNTIITSNEKSANFGNVKWYGKIINHQWSKSLEFEELFDAYIKKYLNPSIHYYSRLRKLFEREIAQKFSYYKKYFEVFSSCNRNFHQDGRDPGSRWCCICPKCLFVYMILRPFITPDDVIKIWGKELYKEESLLPLSQELRGIKGIKPLECVGTIDESKKMTALFIENNNKLATSMILTKRFMNNV